MFRKLAHVAGEGVRAKDAECRVGEGQCGYGASTGEVRGEVLHECGDVFGSLPERGHVKGHHLDAVAEVLAESSRANLCGEIAVRGRNDPDIDGARTRLAEAHDLPGLEHPQEARLRRLRHLGDLVEEERASVCRFEPTYAIGVGPRERASGMAEELALEQRLRQGSAVRGHERAVGSGAPCWRRRAITSFPVPVSPVSAPWRPSGRRA